MQIVKDIFVYGFPNNLSSVQQLTKVGWKKFDCTLLLTKNLSQNIYIAPDNENFLIEEITKFDEKIEEFCDKNKKNYPIILKKDKNYLNWRFVKHPFVKYKKNIVYSNDTGEIISYFVLKKYLDKEGNLTGHIVDFQIGTIDIKEKKKHFQIN